MGRCRIGVNPHVPLNTPKSVSSRARVPVFLAIQMDEVSIRARLGYMFGFMLKKICRRCRGSVRLWMMLTTRPVRAGRLVYLEGGETLSPTRRWSSRRNLSVICSQP